MSQGRISERLIVVADQIKATVSKEDGSSFELVLEFGGSKAKRNTVLRLMQLSVAEQTSQQREWKAGRVSLPAVDVWGNAAGTSADAAQAADGAEDAGASATGEQLPASVEILTDLKIHHHDAW